MRKFIVFCALSTVLFADNFTDMSDIKKRKPHIFDSKPENLSKADLTFRVKIDEKEISMLKKRVATLKGEIAKKSSEHDELSAQLTGREFRVEDLMTKNLELSKKVLDLENSLNLLKTVSTDLQKMKIVQKEFQAMKGDLNRLEQIASVKNHTGLKSFRLEKENNELAKDNKLLRQKIEFQTIQPQNTESTVMFR